MKQALREQLEPSIAQLRQQLAPAIDRLQRVAKSEQDDLDASYKLPTREYPWSCTFGEGLLMYHVARKNRLQRGFEIATAFGFSSLFLAAALRENSGKLTSMDCFIEEAKEDYVYSDEEIRAHTANLRERLTRGERPHCLEFAQSAAAATGLGGTAEYVVGISPQDVRSALGDGPVDLALIDGGHFGEQPSQDFRAVLPQLAAKCAVFFHDNDRNLSVGNAVALAAQELRSTPLVFDTPYRLTLVGRGLDAACLKQLQQALAPAPPSALDQFARRTWRALRRLVSAC